MGLLPRRTCTAPDAPESPGSPKKMPCCCGGGCCGGCGGRRPAPASMLSPTSTFCRPHQSPAVLAGSPSGSRRPSRCPFSGPSSQARQPSRHAPAHPPPPPYPLYVSLRHARDALPVHFSRVRRSKGRLRVPGGPPFSAALAIRPPCNRSSCRPTAAFPLRMQSRPVALSAFASAEPSAESATEPSLLQLESTHGSFGPYCVFFHDTNQRFF